MCDRRLRRQALDEQIRRLADDGSSVDSAVDLGGVCFGRLPELFGCDRFRFSERLGCGFGVVRRRRPVGCCGRVWHVAPPVVTGVLVLDMHGRTAGFVSRGKTAVLGMGLLHGLRCRAERRFADLIAAAVKIRRFLPQIRCARRSVRCFRSCAERLVSNRRVALKAKEKVCRLGGVVSSSKDLVLILLERLNPASDVRGMGFGVVRNSLLRRNENARKLRSELFLCVVLIAEPIAVGERGPVKAIRVSRPVRQFVERRPVIRTRVFEGVFGRQVDAVVLSVVERAVCLIVSDCGATAAEDAFACFY